jgi:chromosome partitioning protein
MAAQIIVVGNEKGGAGKSTLAIHITTALLHADAKVAVLDLDVRQQSLGRFLANRRAWTAANDVALPTATEFKLGEDVAHVSRMSDQEATLRFETAFAEAKGEADYVVMDTPGGDTALSRAAHGKADLIVTPMNDSFVDFDMLGHVDPVTLDLLKPSLYSETVWNARKAKMIGERRSLDWVVLRNRLATVEAKNRRRVEERLTLLAKRVGFRVGPGLRDRVIYRELFPFGLSIADLSPKVRPVAMSLAHVAARQELRAVLHALNLGHAAPDEELRAAS